MRFLSVMTLFDQSVFFKDFARKKNEKSAVRRRDVEYVGQVRNNYVLEYVCGLSAVVFVVILFQTNLLTCKILCAIHDYTSSIGLNYDDLLIFNAIIILNGFKEFLHSANSINILNL